MPEESEMIEQTPEEERLSHAQLQQQRNVANNAQNISNLADVAAKSGNPYAMAAGKTVKAADKLTGGKASENLGKKVNQLSKLSPQGRLLQKASNKMAESGTSDRIGQALSKKKTPAPAAGSVGGKSNATVKDKDNGFFSRKEVHEQTSDGGGVSFQATVKFLKTGLIAFVPVMIVVIFMNLLVAGSQTYLQVIGLGQADEVSNEDVETAIRENGSEGLSDDITDENVDDGSANIGYIYEDEFIEDSITRQKFSEMNFVAIFKYRKFNEADLTQLKEYYSDISSYENGNYNMDTVYTFFFKLLYIQRYYSNASNYNVDLDMPLIMSVLTSQTTDKNEVFVSNIKKYKVSRKENNSDFEYDKNWMNEVLSESSARDIEILAQNMITRVEGSSCYGTVDGACYKLVDDGQYKEFLKQFLERKYYLKGYKLGEVPKDSNYKYAFVDQKNESSVNNLITQIYDTKEQYEDLAGDYTVVEKINPTSNNSYWWPIGSAETEEINGVLYAKGQPQVIGITSDYGATESIRIMAHGGLDIGNGGYGIGVINVIASKSGEVVYPTQDYQTRYADNGYIDNPDGGGYGNFVMIKHSDGSYTIYAHLAQNSITVRAGDVVAQGQVIGKMGHSGSSTGAHLHFEIRIGSDAKTARANPLDYIKPDNPRPMSSSSNFSLLTTTLSKEEFIARMTDYYKRTENENFNKNFLKNAEEIYDASIANNVNPELVVVTAGTEQSWRLDPACQYTNNYWGIGISNGGGCNSGGIYDSLTEGIADYAKLMNAYGEQGNFADMITKRNNERAAAGCDPAGHGLPGTLEGMQSIYSWAGDYRWDPGSWGSGGCVYYNEIYGENYCSTMPTCASSTATDNCPVESKTTVCEQNDYTAHQLKEKFQFRYDIFGL